MRPMPAQPVKTNKLSRTMNYRAPTRGLLPTVLAGILILGGIANPCSSHGQSYQLTISVTGQGTVTSSPTGIDCGSSCSAMYADGTTVTLTIAAAPGWYITSSGLQIQDIAWQLAGSPLRTNVTGTVTINQNTTINVSFSRALLVTKTGSGT